MCKKSDKKKCVIGPLNAKQRNVKAFNIRYRTAMSQMNTHLAEHQCNGDEGLFPNKIGNFSKGLPHNTLGEVDINSYKSFIKALNSGKVDDFNAIPMGGVVKLANPQGAYVFDLIGADCHKMSIAVPPTFSSTWNAGEMVEVYWQSITRDVPFQEYDIHPLMIAAATELSGLTDFRGPKMAGEVTTETLFRGDTPGDLVGPYISQFLLLDIPFGAKTITQQYRTTLAGSDHMTYYNEWLNIQNGEPPKASITDPEPRYIRNGRDLSAYVRQDFTFQSPLSACLILQGWEKKQLHHLIHIYLQQLREALSLLVLLIY